ncbi:MAG TPA: antitoxin family protein, partial [Thermodesulfobacteriota bacterium]|nr:antitoxin family protein [Thermodesulfobacteriota bacterium]
MVEYKYFNSRGHKLRSQNMAKTIEAIYKDGVIKPLEKVELKENERVRVTIIRMKKAEIEELEVDPKKDPILN